MLPLSQTTGYAVRALACLQEPGGHPVLVEEVAEFTGIPRFYLSKLVHKLAMRGLVVARHGHHGGVVLAKPLTDILLEDLSDAIEGATWRHRGLMGLLGYRQAPHDVHRKALPGTLIHLLIHWRTLTVADLVQSHDSEFERFRAMSWTSERTARRAAQQDDQRLNGALRKTVPPGEGGPLPTDDRKGPRSTARLHPMNRWRPPIPS